MPPPDSAIAPKKLENDAVCSSVANRIARALKARGVAVWLMTPARNSAPSMTLTHTRDFTRPEGMPAAEWQKSVGGAISRCASQKGPVRAVWKGPNPEDEPSEFLFVPVIQEGAVAGVAGFVGDPSMVDAFREHHEILADSLALLALQPGAKGVPSTTPNGLASLAIALLTTRDSATAARISADVLRELLEAPRVCLFEQIHGKWRLVASSGAKSIDRHGAEAKTLLEKFAHCREGKPPEGTIGGVLSRWHEDEASRHTGWLVERPKATPSEEAILHGAAPLVAHALHSRRTWLRRTLAQNAGGNRWLSRGIFLGVLLLLALLLFYPVHQNFSGRCELLPSERGVAVAEISARIDEVLVEEGEVVPLGAPIMKLDSSAIDSRLEVARQEQRKGESETRRLQQAGEMAEFRIAQLEWRRSSEEVKKLEEDKRRCTILAPLAGVILTKDLALRRGEVVEPGSVVCEMASLTNWDLQIKINEADAGWLAEALRDRGRLPIRYVLQARSDLSLQAELTSDVQVSQMAYPDAGATILFVTIQGIDLPRELLEHMRPGFSGMAKIEGKKAPFITVAFSRLLQWFRLRVLL